MGEYRYTFRLMPGRDDDLIQWLETLGEGERSFYIRQILRRGLAGPVTPALSIPSRAPVAASKKQPQPIVQETVEVAPDTMADDIEARLDRLANSF